MCGIVGIINRNNKSPELAIMREMADLLNHRGPDDEGWLIEGSVGLYHKRLSIIDLVSGHQPMSYGKFSIVFNGEIYNYIELRDALKKLGHVFKTNSDTEVILQMYSEYGIEFIDRLNGMFSFLLYDRERNLILAARDHFGIKPLYFHINQENILFASEIKAILCHPNVQPVPNNDAIQDYLTFQYVLGQATLFKNIEKLSPAHYMVINLDKFNVKLVKYWDPTFKIDTYHTEEYFVHQLRDLLEDTIRMQIRSDVPLGAYLSGGMDSSIVTLLASKFISNQMKAFTGAFQEGPEFDETVYAREVAKRCDAKLFEIYPTPTEFIDLLPRLIYYLDEPAAGPGLFPQYIVSKLAAEQVKVVLGGQGGDEIFGGYARYIVAYLEQALKGAIFESNEEGEHIVSLKSILPNLPFLRNYIPMIRSFWQKEPFDAMDKRYFHLIDRTDWSCGLFTSDFQAEYNKDAIFHRFQQIFNHPDTLSYFNKMTHFDMFSSLPALLHVEDRMSMAVSLESRVPLLDRKLVDLVTSMPPAMKFKGAEMKYILKRAVCDLLPKSVLERKDKMGFPVPLHIWARNGARDFFADILLSRRCLDRGIVAKKGVEKLIHSERAYGRQLWGLICLEIWFQTFIDDAQYRTSGSV